MATTRELALEASVRFTDRNKYTVKEMLTHAGEIEDWMNRDLPKLKFVNNNGVESEWLSTIGNPIHKIAVAYHQYGKDNGRLPTKVYCNSGVLAEIYLQIGTDETRPTSFQFAGLKVLADESLSPDELKFAD